MWWPWASAVWGEVQFELMMAILWENMAEPCSFGPQRPPPFPIGQYTSKAVQKSLAWPLLHTFDVELASSTTGMTHIYSEPTLLVSAVPWHALQHGH